MGIDRGVEPKEEKIKSEDPGPKGKTRKKKERNLNAMNSLPKIRKTRILFISYFLSLTSIFTFFFFGEIRNLTTFCLLPLVNNGFSLSSFFLSLLSFGVLVIHWLYKIISILCLYLQ